MWWLYIIIFVVGFIVGTIFVIAKAPIMGTMYIDMDSRDDKDIARIIWERTLEEITKNGLAMVKIVKKHNLSSLDELR